MKIKLIFVYAVILLLLGISVFNVMAEGSGAIERVSVASDGTQSDNVSYAAVISDNGRYIAFWSYASNLVPNDENNTYDVFVRDRQTNTTTRVSVTCDRTEGNGESCGASISGDGRYIAFQSIATNLVPNDVNDYVDSFVYDQRTHITSIVSVASDGTQGNSFTYDPSLSGDGRYVAFCSNAANFVPNDINGYQDIFVHDLRTGATTIVSVASNGTQGNGNSSLARMSRDGRYISFVSDASNLVPNDHNNKYDVFVRDRKTNTTTRVSVASDGTESNDNSNCAVISGDGRYVAFSSWASNLVPGDINGCPDVFVRDLKTNTTIRINVASNGAESKGGGDFPSMSGDVRYITFYSNDGYLVPNDANRQPDIFVQDWQMNKTTIVSVASDGTQSNDSSCRPCISGNGHFIVFESLASNLVPNDTNDSWDIFVTGKFIPTKPVSAGLIAVLIMGIVLLGTVLALLVRHRT